MGKFLGGKRTEEKKLLGDALKMVRLQEWDFIYTKTVSAETAQRRRLDEVVYW
jgi:hypothetical protein